VEQKSVEAEFMAQGALTRRWAFFSVFLLSIFYSSSFTSAFAANECLLVKKAFRSRFGNTIMISY
jgi:hypothetical protein